MRGLLAVLSRPHVEVVARFGKTQVFEKDPVHGKGVVLPRVDDVIGFCSRLELSYQR
jgi:hypothetical protein